MRSQYKATTKPPEQIAKELGVGYLLVAKVRWQKSGKASRIRLTSELVEVAGGGAPTTRWQEAFEADLSDVFRVQGEIATKVAQVAGGGAVREGARAPHGASHVEPRGVRRLPQGTGDREGEPVRARRAVAQYEQAVALDPGFALAWARLSIRRSCELPLPRRRRRRRRGRRRSGPWSWHPACPRRTVPSGPTTTASGTTPKRPSRRIARGLSLAPDDAGLLLDRAPSSDSSGGGTTRSRTCVGRGSRTLARGGRESCSGPLCSGCDAPARRARRSTVASSSPRRTST